MCGRFVLDERAGNLRALFDADVVGDDLPPPSWNIAPTDRIQVVIDSVPKAAESPEPVRRLEAARWGLVPGWTKGPSAPGPPQFNARSESAIDKPTFRSAVRKRRTVVPASGYYEWRRIGETKVPQFIFLPDGELLLFAGLYEWWRDPDAADDAPDRWLLSAAIMTRSSTGELASIHDRMPVFLEPDLVEEWLDPVAEGTPGLIEQAVHGGAEVAARMQFHEVDRAVGSVRNNSPELTAPLA